MRFDVKKYLFVGSQGALEGFFNQAQETALVHFIDPYQLKAKEIPLDIEHLRTAIKIVRELPTLDQEEPESKSEVDRMTENILNLKQQIDTLEEEQRITRLEMARVQVFGQFSLEDVAFIESHGQRIIQYFFAKKGVKEQGELSDNLFFIDSEYGLDYFISINKEPKQYEHMIEMKIDNEYAQIKKRYLEIEKEIKDQERKLKSYAKYDTFLHHSLAQKYNDYHLVTAKNFAQKKASGHLFAVEGWVPQIQLPKLKRAMKEIDVECVEVAIEEEETAPTYLENKGVNRIGEDLVHIYDTPGNTDKDPSLWVLLSFAFFFAMIINDGGYGMIFLATALYFRLKKPHLPKTGLRIWKLVVILCSFTIAWGVLTNSFFGLSIAPESIVKKVSVLHWLDLKKAAYHIQNQTDSYQEWVKTFPETQGIQDPEMFLATAKEEIGGSTKYVLSDQLNDGILMELALVVGMVHVALGFLRYLGRNWAGVGWILAIIGAYCYLPLFLDATSIPHYLFGFDREVIAEEGLYMMYAGVAIALVLSLIQNKLLGLLEITNVIQIFADILSYLRLYALGLAGAIISATVNDIAGSLNFLGGGLILLIGHSINMGLSIMGGVIHGLRLNFIEWYHYCFEGGGQLFDPLRKIEYE